jgi:hypothetical protein
MNEELTPLEEAKIATQNESAGHWPTVAAVLLEEVERLEKALARTNLKSASFEQWWEDVGSGIRPHLGKNAEEHAKTASRSAWVACYAFLQ